MRYCLIISALFWAGCHAIVVSPHETELPADVSELDDNGHGENPPKPNEPAINITPKNWFIQLLHVDESEFQPGHEIYVLDLFETPASFFDSAHAQGAEVFCYFSAGSYEGWRPDVGEVSPDSIGTVYEGFENENWWDIRNDDVKNVVLSRLDLAKEKGCDGVDPDNVNGHENDTGLEISATAQLVFNKWLSKQARERNLKVGLKNNLSQIPELVDYFDFAINESCYFYGECDAYYAFLKVDKPVLILEYEQSCSKIESNGSLSGATTLKATYDLDGILENCANK